MGRSWKAARRGGPTGMISPRSPFIVEAHYRCHPLTAGTRETRAAYPKSDKSARAFGNVISWPVYLEGWERQMFLAGEYGHAHQIVFGKEIADRALRNGPLEEAEPMCRSK
jgi:hypothetical protein